MKSTVRILVLVLLMSIPTIMRAQIAALEKYADEPNMLYTYVSETMIRMAIKYGKSEAAGEKFGGMMNKLTSIQEISTFNEKANERLVAEIKAIAKKDNYELLITTDRASEKTLVYFKPAKTKKEKSAVLIINLKGKNTTVVGLQGYFDSDDIGKMINAHS